MRPLIRCIVIATLAMSNVPALANEVRSWQAAISTGIAYRQQGNLELSIEALTEVRRLAS